MVVYWAEVFDQFIVGSWAWANLQMIVVRVGIPKSLAKASIMNHGLSCEQSGIHRWLIL